VVSTVAAAARIANASAWAARAAWATSSALYVCAIDTAGTTLSVYKSTDGTTWAEQDAADAPAVADATYAYSSWLHTDGYLYTARFSATNTLRVRRFDTATDAWETTDFPDSDVTTDGANTASVRLAVRSDGDIVVTWKDLSDGFPHRRRYDGSAWNTDASITGLLGHPLDIVVMVNGYTLLYYQNTQGNDASYRTLSTSEVMGTETDFDAAVNTTPTRSAIAALFNDGTDDRVAAANRDTGGELDVYVATEGTTTLGAITTINAVSTSTAVLQTSLAMDAHSSKLWALWSTANAILYDSSDDLTSPAFGSDTTLISSLTDTDPCPQWIRGGVGTVGYGAVYNDNGAVKVEWIVVPAFTTDATGTVSSGSLAVAGQAVAATGDSLANVAGGTLAVAGQAVAADPAVAAAVATGGHAVAGQAVAAEAGAVGTVAAGGLTVAGQAIDGVEEGTPDTGTVATGGHAVAGQAVAADAGAVGTVAVGALAASGQAVSGLAGSLAAVAAGSLSVAGQAVAGVGGTVGVVGGGELAVAGETVTGSEGGTPATGDVATGTLAVAGQAVAGVAGSLGTVDGGVVVVAGQALSGGVADLGTVGAGAYAVSGQAVAADPGALGAVASGALAVAGQAVGGEAGTVADIVTAVLVVAGQAVVGLDGVLPSAWDAVLTRAVVVGADLTRTPAVGAGLTRTPAVSPALTRTPD
jgi:hypothetical protein